VTLKLEDKKEIVAEVNKVASGAFSAVVANYRGLTVGQLTASCAKKPVTSKYTCG
jgi:large subunit ribosomal protein L10